MERLQNPKMRQRGLSDNESTCRIAAVCKDHPWRKRNIIERLAVKLRPVFATLLISCLAVLFGVPASGQNVTISPSSGHLIAGLTYTGEVGFGNGWSSLWRHNQLPLTLLVSDKADLTPGGVLKDPAGDICLDTKQNLYVVGSGEPAETDLHMSISLPKGYRFTGYRIVLLNNVNGKTVNNMENGYVEKVFYETDQTFSTSVPKGYPAPITIPSEDDDKEYVMERTSKSYTDMGNNLYFLLDHDTKGFYAVTIKSIELYFTAEAEFEAHGVPGTPAEIISNGVNKVGSEFTTGKLDLGTIKPNKKDGSDKTYFSYDYRNVIDLTAQNWLYQDDAVTAEKKLPETAGSGSIQVLQNGGKLYYALGNGTYYIETPTETKDQTGKTIPLGYRITGAKINAHYGKKAPSSTVTYNGDNGTISHKVLDDIYELQAYFKTYYLQTNGTWDTSPQTHWTLTKTGKLKNGETYLYVKPSDSGGNVKYIVKGTTDINQASTFTISNGNVKWEDNYLTFNGRSMAGLESYSNYAATWTAEKSKVSNPAYTPSNFTLDLYGTNKNKVEQTANISSKNPDKTLTVTKLNNDAVKFTISGLAGDAKALITYDLTMEQLNPFINTLDIVCHSKEETGPTITQTFTSNDFQVAGGKFNFYIPADFADANNNCRFTFENLKSKYMDETYDNGTSGNARNFFVKSAYYNKYGDGNQYSATGNEPATDKVVTAQCGNEPFKYNNAADLDASRTTAKETTLEEYPYSEARYTAKNGSGTSTGKQGTFTENIEVRVNDPAKDCYLFTGDETRYNIAPTTAMEHRAYAFYLMQIDLQVKEYDAYCRMTKLYEKTCYDGQNEKPMEKPMYGGVFEAYRKGHAGDKNYQIPSDSAFLSVSMMVKALKEAEHRGEETFSADQVLYLDYTNLYSVMVESKDSMAAMKAKLNPNCLIFFPQTTYYDEDNYVQKTQGGGFRACRNIVITDKQPFFSPYKISVPKENYAYYKRKITNLMNGKATKATLVLPFSISVSNGVHTNGDCSFTLYQMQTDNCLTIDKEEKGNGTDFWGKATFKPITGTLTKPNTPYLVVVKNASNDENASFEVKQYGSDVEATVNTNSKDGNSMNNDYTFTGETATGTIGGQTHAFTNYGSYAGKKLAKTGGWFYFAQGKFYNSKNLSYKYNDVYLYPFRAYFAHQASNAKLMAGFNVAFDDDLTTGIDDLTVDTPAESLQLSTNRGQLTLKAAEPIDVEVYSTAGVTMLHMALSAGETKTIALSSGLYIVNGKKVIIP